MEGGPTITLTIQSAQFGKIHGYEYKGLLPDSSNRLIWLTKEHTTYIGQLHEAKQEKSNTEGDEILLPRIEDPAVLRPTSILTNVVVDRRVDERFHVLVLQCPQSQGATLRHIAALKKAADSSRNMGLSEETCTEVVRLWLQFIERHIKADKPTKTFPSLDEILYFREQENPVRFVGFEDYWTRNGSLASSLIDLYFGCQSDPAEFHQCKESLPELFEVFELTKEAISEETVRKVKQSKWFSQKKVSLLDEIEIGKSSVERSHSPLSQYQSGDKPKQSLPPEMSLEPENFLCEALLRNALYKFPVNSLQTFRIEFGKVFGRGTGNGILAQGCWQYDNISKSEFVLYGNVNGTVEHTTMFCTASNEHPQQPIIYLPNLPLTDFGSALLQAIKYLVQKSGMMFVEQIG